MNLQGITAAAVGTVNPLIYATVTPSAGSTTNPDGSQTPIYGAPLTLQVQVQPLQWQELQQLDGINVQGERRAVYVPGSQWDGISRVDQRGGDLLTFAEAPGGPLRVWLVVQLIEKFADWVKLAVTLQDE